MITPTSRAFSSVTFTVAICTWNRASLLLQTLERLAHIDDPDCPWELIVVNNCSTDATEEVLNLMASRLPLRRVFEPESGLSCARNAAIRHASGDYIIWTDDDVIVNQNWLRAYERAIERWPDAAVFGGPIRPRFEGTPPAWLSAVWDDVAGMFAAREFGTQSFELTKERLPYGANFVVRVREQSQFLYDPNLGRRQAAGALGEEVAVIEAILAAGHKGRWVPDALVEHWIPKERQTVKYLRGHCALLGRTRHRQDRNRVGPRRVYRYSLWGQALYAEIKYTFARLTGNPRRWLKPLIRASTLWGEIKQ